MPETQAVRGLASELPRRLRYLRDLHVAADRRGVLDARKAGKRALITRGSGRSRRSQPSSSRANP